MGAAIAAAGTAAAGIAGGLQKDRQEQTNDRRTQGKVEDASLRNEANYRGNRAMLMTGISDFYKKKGWSMPEFSPGYGTTRTLPGEGSLYSGQPKSDWSYGSGPTVPSASKETADAPVSGGAEALPAIGAGATTVGATRVAPKGPERIAPAVQPMIQDEELSKLLTPYGYL